MCGITGMITLKEHSIKNDLLRKATTWGWLIFLVAFNIYIAPYHKKADFKSTFLEINNFAQKEDFVYAKTPIGFLESAYYYKYPESVYIYNPNEIAIPNYIGVTVLFPNISRLGFPSPPSKTFLIDDNTSYQLIINR